MAGSSRPYIFFVTSDSSREVDRFGRGRLHAIGEFVRFDPRVQFAFARASLRVMPVQVSEKIERAALLRVADLVRAFQMQDRRTFALQQRALICGGKESRTPVLRAADHALVVGEDHERRAGSRSRFPVRTSATRPAMAGPR